MTLFHGSESIIEKPEYGRGKPYNDYGLGFYCTQNALLAKEWAVDENRDGYVNAYDIDITNLKVVDLNSDDYCVLHWITILLQNRRFELDSRLAREAYRYLTKNFTIDLAGADIVMGYRADDSYFAYARDFVNGQISVNQLAEAMKLGDLGEQVMIRSPKAFSALKYVGCDGVAASEWYPRKMNRDKSARQTYRIMDFENFRHGELYMIHIIEQEIKADDPRLQ